MANTIVLYDVLVSSSPSSPTENGVWSRLSNSGPTAPAVWNAAIDFSAQTFGYYEYRYTVNYSNGYCESNAEVGVNWSEHTPPGNDTCNTAVFISFPHASGIVGHYGETNQNTCPGPAFEYSNVIPTPSIWGSGNTDFNGDVWYKVVYTATGPTLPLSMIMTVDGTPYGTLGIDNPLAAWYMDSNCGASAAIEAVYSGTQQAVMVADDLFTSNHTFYIRVCSYQNTSGLFDIDINVI